MFMFYFGYEEVFVVCLDCELAVIADTVVNGNSQNAMGLIRIRKTTLAKFQHANFAFEIGKNNKLTDFPILLVKSIRFKLSFIIID